MSEFQLLTNSRRGSFGSCHRKHYFQYELGVRPISDAEALRFGTLIHAGLEAWLLALWQGPDQALSDGLAALQANAPKAEADAYVQNVGKAMLEGYHDRWHAEGFEVLAVEQHFEIALVNPDTNGQSRTWKLAGKIDGIVRTSDGKVRILEHKTTRDQLTADSRYWTKLAIDGQVSGYYMGAKALGYEVEGCVYDVLRKPALRPSQVPIVEDGAKVVLDANGERVRTKDGKKWKETGDSSQGYTLQTRLETPEELYTRLRADIAANPDSYFRRLEVPRLDADLVEYLSDMWAVGREIAEAQVTRRWPKNPRSCDSYGTCPYFEVCAGRESIDNPHVFKRGEIHPELSGGIAEGGY